MRTRIEQITSPAELDRALASSRIGPVWIFKHSLVCGASSGALREFRTFVAQNPGPMSRFGLIEIQNAREVSRTLAGRTGVPHQSPQVILLKDERAVWHASHWDITVESLARAAATAA
jgi:bacillithiol system protein YtxJ